MKQFQIAYKNDGALLEELEQIKGWCAANPSYTTLFRVYSEDMDLEHVRHVCDILKQAMPDALYFGCTSNGNILNGALSEAKIVLTCTVFEYATTQVRLLQLPFTEEDVPATVGRLKEFCAANPWVSAVETLANMLGMSVRSFCDEMSTLPDHIQVFGGGACNSDPNNLTSGVFSKGNGFSAHGVVFLLLGGEDFHTYSTCISGWQPLKRRFKVTKADRELLYELDGEPAFNIYQRFLNIEKNDQLVSNTLEFPLLVDLGGVDVLRCPIGVNDDNSLVMTSEVEEGADVRIAYGDPETILSSILHDGQNIADFQPEVIQTFSCAARRAFWGDDNVSSETVQFSTVAPTSGFYTGGEILRTKGVVRHYNITLVFAAMREGEAKNGETVNIYHAKLDDTDSERITLIRRFISFIGASTAEFEALNRRLAITSVTDGLTGLYNRAEIEHRIRATLDESAQGKALSLIMLDIDNFKKINDVYGHQEGDHVIVAMADVLRSVLTDVSSACIGRWGGEEFMVLLPDSDVAQAAALAEKIRAEYASISYESAGCQTVSIGVVQAQEGEDADMLYSRVDKALYTAKANGKNQVVKLN